MEENKIVVIKVKLKTRDRLKASGKKGESYDDVISAMLEKLGRDKRESNT
jgi:hypothetical protein